MAEARADEVKRLARILVAGAPLTCALQQAAEALADAIFSLHAIRRARTDLMTPNSIGATAEDVMTLIDQIAAFDGYSEAEATLIAQELQFEDGEAANWQQLLDTMVGNTTELRRLDEYERKAHSRYLKSVNRFDYAMIEATRTR